MHAHKYALLSAVIIITIIATEFLNSKILTLQSMHKLMLKVKLWYYMQQGNVCCHI